MTHHGKAFPLASLAAALSLLLASCETPEEATPPAYNAPDAIPAKAPPEEVRKPGEDAFQKRRMEWLFANFLDCLSKDSPPDAPWIADAKTFMESSCSSLCQQPGAASPASLERDGLDLIAKGCDSPTVHFWLAEAMRRNGRIKDAMPHFRRAASKFQQAGLADIATALAAAGLHESLAGDETLSTLANAAGNVAAESFVRAASAKAPISPPEPRFVFREMDSFKAPSSHFWGKAFKSASTSTPPWLVKMLEAKALLEEGKDLGKAMELAVSCGEGGSLPEPPCLCLEILTAAASPRDSKQAERIFRLSTGAQSDYIPAYRDYIKFLSLEPDSEKRLLDFAASCLDEKEMPVKRMSLAAIFNAAALRPDCSWRKVFALPNVKAMAGTLYAQLLAQASLPDWKKDCLSLEHAILLAWCGEHGPAKDILLKTPSVSDLSFQNSFQGFDVPWRPRSMEAFESELRAFTGAYKDDMLAWMALDESTPEGREAYSEALRKLLLKVSSDKGIKELVRNWAALSMAGLPAAGLHERAFTNPLMFALEKPCPEMARFLIENGCLLKFKDPKAKSPLLVSLESGVAEDIPKMLVSRGAAVDARGAAGETPLHLALRRGYDPTASLIVEMGADLNAKDSDGRTPLHLAAAFSKALIAKLMLKRHADADSIDNAGQTPLHLAAAAGSVDCVVLLIPKTSRLDRRDSAGLSAETIASKAGHKEIAKAIADGIALRNRRH